jgi:hypothetical protein
MNRVSINKEVSVTALYFRNNSNRDRLKSYPKRMEYNGREYNFTESGLRYLIHKGQQLIQVFDMSDGLANYRLRFDGQNKLWTLVDITEAPRAFA